MATDLDRRDMFAIPDGVIYLNGNSLGALSRAVPQRIAAVLSDEWGDGLIRSWNDAKWIGLPTRVAARIAPLLGAAAADVVVADSTSVTLFKSLAAAARLRPGRNTLVLEPSTFPTDGYVAASVARLLGLDVRWCDPTDPLASLDDDVAVLALCHVDYRTGSMFDLGAVTAAAHDAGALMHWDLCHSAGAVPVDLAAHDVDFAVGCTYKYLNGGPGSPAFSYVSPRLQGDVDQPVPGWMSHAEPFAMVLNYAPAPGIERMLSGTPPVIALSALDTALGAFDGLVIETVREASLSLTDLFLELVDARLGSELAVVTPREHARRGSQVSLRHEHAYGIVEALIARGVIGDFRPPDIVRLGFAPLYIRPVDVFDAVEHLGAVLDGGEHLRPARATPAWQRNAATARPLRRPRRRRR
jgi:kynureninase